MGRRAAWHCIENREKWTDTNVCVWCDAAAENRTEWMNQGKHNCTCSASLGARSSPFWIVRLSCAKCSCNVAAYGIPYTSADSSTRHFTRPFASHCPMADGVHLIEHAISSGRDSGGETCPRSLNGHRLYRNGHYIAITTMNGRCRKNYRTAEVVYLLLLLLLLSQSIVRRCKLRYNLRFAFNANMLHARHTGHGARYDYAATAIYKKRIM